MEEVFHWIEEEGFMLYGEAKVLSEEVSKTDPETEPYRSKYQAREILKKLKAKLDSYLTQFGDTYLDSTFHRDYTMVRNENAENLGEVEAAPPQVSIRCLSAVLEYDLGLNFYECDEIKTGEDHFQTCIQLVSAFQDDPQYFSVLLAVHNQLSILWSNRGLNEQALKQLKIAEHLYKDAHRKEIKYPVYFGEVWLPNKNCLHDTQREEKFENLHTLTLYYLAQVHGVLGNLELSGRYCHVTLVRQMETGQYEPVEWSLNCATLSQYYVTKDQFSFARYSLACSQRVNEIAFEKHEPETFDESERERQEEKLEKSKADVFRCWAKYGLNLLKQSHSAMINEGSRDSVPDSSSLCEKEDIVKQDLKELRFGKLDVQQYEAQVSDSLAHTFQEAKGIFQFSQKCLSRAKEFYKLDGFVSDFVEIQQDVSQFYKYLAFFEDSFETRCKMHKRRIDMLNDVLCQLNPQHFLQICRQLTFEIAETYAEMADLKKAIMEEDRLKVEASKVKKMNFLLLQSVKYYQTFIDSYKKNDKLPDKFEEDAVRGILLTFFCMGRVFSKYTTSEKHIKTEYMTKEYDCYKFIVEYCDHHAEAAEIMGEELAISREMVGLFSIKMSNVLDRM